MTEKLAKTQYFSFLCPVYVFRHLPWRYIASSGVKTCKKTNLGVVPELEGVVESGCKDVLAWMTIMFMIISWSWVFYHWVRTWQKTQEGCHRRSTFSGTGLNTQNERILWINFNFTISVKWKTSSTWSCVPDPAEPIIAAAHNQAPIPSAQFHQKLGSLFTSWINWQNFKNTWRKSSVDSWYSTISHLLKWTAETGSECAGRVLRHLPVLTSQIRTDSSKDPGN